MSDESKICPMCAETIRAAAKLCPHCRHVQSTWNLFNPSISSSLGAICWLVGILVLSAVLWRLVGKRDFENYAGQFSIVESTVSQRTTTNSSWIVITGVLTNGSDCSWKSIGIEGQLFDQDGKMIEVIPASVEYNPLHVVAAHGFCAFKIESRSSHSPSDIASHKVFVRWAKDANSWP